LVRKEKRKKRQKSSHPPSKKIGKGGRLKVNGKGREMASAKRKGKQEDRRSGVRLKLKKGGRHCGLKGESYSSQKRGKR